MVPNEEGYTYAKAGVDRKAEEENVRSILQIIKTTYENSTVPEGHFAGSIEFGDYILSLATDGVGSKVILAQEFDKYDTIGIDCVAMNVNDLITIGSIPQAFVDYIAIRLPDKKITSDIVKGLADGCIQAGIPLVGGETAILPDIIATIENDNGFDVAGTALGIHKKDEGITGEKIKPGDIILGIESSGIHSNGLTLARKVIQNKQQRLELLTPTRIYVDAIKSLLDANLAIHGMAHITGGGMTNLSRLGQYHYDLDLTEVNYSDIFNSIQESAKISTKEMYRTFNMGIGFVILVSPEDKKQALSILNEFYPTYEIGVVNEGNKVTINDEIQL